MKKKLNNTSFLYSDYFKFMLGLRGPSTNRYSSNLLNTTGPCCPLDYDGSLTSSCKRRSKTCKAPDSTHIFFDPRHPTQLANFMYSIACFDERTICHVVWFKFNTNLVVVYFFPHDFFWTLFYQVLPFFEYWIQRDCFLNINVL